VARVYKGLDVRGDFEGRFPWKSKSLNLASGQKLAYVDEGPRDAQLTFLCVHGNPTWGYLYREFIRDLSQEHRVVVPDLLGFGRSDKPREPAAYSLAGHIDAIEALLHSLRLKNVVLVVQDWGGPIGFGVATRNIARVAGVVILNTWAFVSEDGGPRIPWLFKLLVRGRGGWRRATKGNIFTEQFLVRMQKLDAVSQAAYRAPHPTPDDRVGIARFPVMIPEVNDVKSESYHAMKEIEDQLPLLGLKPALIVWPLQDPAFRKPQLERWRRVFPNHVLHKVPDAKHYIQESHSHEILKHIHAWLPTWATTKGSKPGRRKAKPAPGKG
jgi:pimeloyl-ACP methyl ester carboxylesterase